MGRAAPCTHSRSHRQPGNSAVAELYTLILKVSDGRPRWLSGKESACTLFTIAGTWEQPSCPSADKWIRKLWYRYTVECYSAIKQNAFESALMRWMKLEAFI